MVAVFQVAKGGDDAGGGSNSAVAFIISRASKWPSKLKCSVAL